jgi:hypothetical protein
MGAPPRLPDYGYPTATDFVSDPMLLLIKATINYFFQHVRERGSHQLVLAL